MLIGDATNDAGERTVLHSVTHSLDKAVAALCMVMGGIFFRVGINKNCVEISWLVLILISLVSLALSTKVLRNRPQ